MAITDEIWPRSGQSLETIIAQLKDWRSRLDGVANSRERELIDSYLTWCAQADEVLAPILEPSAINRLVLTRRYWATLANHVDSNPEVAAVRAELRRQQAVFDAAIAATEALRARWSNNYVRTIVADTNTYLHVAPYSIAGIDWHRLADLAGVSTKESLRLVMSMVVVDELDRIKDNRSSSKDASSRARILTRELWDLFESIGAEEVVTLVADNGGFAGLTFEVLADRPGHVRLPRNDDELVARATAIQSLISSPPGRGVVFLTGDAGARLRAKMAGLVTTRRPVSDPVSP